MRYRQKSILLTGVNKMMNKQERELEIANLEILIKKYPNSNRVEHWKGLKQILQENK
jgi:hypothetical protein